MRIDQRGFQLRCKLLSQQLHLAHRKIGVRSEVQDAHIVEVGLSRRATKDEQSRIIKHCRVIPSLWRSISKHRYLLPLHILWRLT